MTTSDVLTTFAGLLGVVVGLLGSFFTTRMQLAHAAREGERSRRAEFVKIEWTEHRAALASFMRISFEIFSTAGRLKDLVDDDRADEIVDKLIDEATQSLHASTGHMAATTCLLPAALAAESEGLLNAINAYATSVKSGEGVDDASNQYVRATDMFVAAAIAWSHKKFETA